MIIGVYFYLWSCSAPVLENERRETEFFASSLTSCTRVRNGQSFYGRYLGNATSYIVLHACLILFLISSSSCSVTWMMDPRYLNSFVNGILFWLLLSIIFGGIVLFLRFSLACSRLGGMSMARVFDSSLFFPTCIFSLNLARWEYSSWAMASIPSLVVDMKAPSSTYMM